MLKLSRFPNIIWRYFSATARQNYEEAIKEFREMKMQPSLERALIHKDILKAWLTSGIRETFHHELRYINISKYTGLREVW